MNGTPEETAGTPPNAQAEQPKVAKKARVAPHGADVRPCKPKSGKKASQAQKAAKSPKSAKSPKTATVARQGSKTARVLGLLKRSGGVTLRQLTTATGWQSHSVRGFLSGALGKKMGLIVTSTKAEGGERRYSVKA